MSNAVCELCDARRDEKPKGTRRKLVWKLGYIIPFEEQAGRGVIKENKQIFNPLGKRFGR